jgi:hypothetical protein
MAPYNTSKMKTAYYGSFVMSARKNSLHAYFTLMMVASFSGHLLAQVNNNGQTEKTNPFVSAPIDVLENSNPNELLSVERTVGSNGLVILEKEKSYYAVKSGKLSEAIWSTERNGNPTNITSYEEPFHLNISYGMNVTFDLGEIHVLSLDLETGANLDLENSSVYITRDFTIDGALTCGKSKVFFNGTEEQKILGNRTAELYDVTSNNTSGVSIETPGISLLHVLQINEGTFYTRGKLTLISNEFGTAQIGPLLNGADLKNNVIVQRFHQSLVQSWVNLGAAVQGKTVADWNDDIITTGFPGADYPSYPVNNVRTFDNEYDGTFEERFRGVALENTSLQNKRGYFVFSNPGVVLFDLEGAIFKGEQSLPVCYATTEFENTDGWNLVANPYPCSIDWESNFWTKKNIESPLYVWNPEKSQFMSYVNGVGNLGGSNIIGSSESFFVLANDVAPILKLNENVKFIGDISQHSKNDADAVLHLKVHHVRGEDETTIVWNDGCGAQYEALTDAYKLRSPAEVPYLSTRSSNGADLSINSLERQDNRILIPIVLEVPEDAIYTISWTGADAFTKGSCTVFRDDFTGISYALNEIDHINLELSKGKYIGRFFIEAGRPALAEITPPSCYGFADATATIQGEGDGPWNVIWTDTNGISVRQVENVYGNEVIEGLAAGSYHLIIENNGFCSDTRTSVEIPQPAKIEIGVASRAETCPQNSDGSALVDVQGGTAPYTITWENGIKGAYLNDVHAGAYLVAITDAHLCSSTEVVEIPRTNELEADFETFGSTFEMKNGAVLVDFYNTSIAAEEFEWNFGDGTIRRINDNPSHMYNKPGDYEVTLRAQDRDCISSVVKTIRVTALGESDAELSSMINGVRTDNGIMLSFVLDQPRTLRICAWNLLGQQIFSPRIGEFYRDSLQISDKRYTTGSLVEIIDESTGERTVLKF